MSQTIQSIIEEIKKSQISGPVYVFRQNMVAKAIRYFIDHFKCQIIYAVKANPDPLVLKILWDHGINKFDVASLNEIEVVFRELPQAILYFMNTIKSPMAIRKAYYEYGVRHFVVDSFDELKKISEEIPQMESLHLYVRIEVFNHYSLHKLDRKFGLATNQAPLLLRECSNFTKNLGVSFHIGGQCMNPVAYEEAIQAAATVIRQSKVQVHSLDIGGGIPSTYTNLSPPPLHEYFEKIESAFEKTGLDCELFCEPGRPLVAEAGSIITRVELRKNNFLYLNEGRYGPLFDLGNTDYVFPVRLLRTGSAEKINYNFYGPTCDSYDHMAGPFLLPADIERGDFIEIGQLGAYGLPLASSFNGFGQVEKTFFTDDPPILSMYT